MDILNLNYRQLQAEAKRRGIKANQKIEILRLKVSEALELSKNVIEDNCENKINVDDINLSILSENDLEFHNDIQNYITSTPARVKLESSLINNFEISSTDDIDKILGSNRRNSQFFDDIIRFSFKGPEDHENATSDNVDDTKFLGNKDNYTENNHLSEGNQYEPDNEIENVPIRKRKLNTTFNLDEDDLKESEITEVQRKCANKNEKIILPEPRKTIATFKEPGFRTKSNMQQRFVKMNEIINSNLQKKGKIEFNDTNINTRRGNLSPKFIKPLGVNTITTNVTRVAANPRQSTCFSQDKSTNFIYSKKPARASMLPIPNKSKRQTFGNNLSSKCAWKN